MKILLPRQVEFARHLALGKPAAEAARLAGYGRAYAAHAAGRMARKPIIAAEIERQRERIREATAYDAQAMMAELDNSMAFARETKNATALVRAIELRGKLHGLLIERREQLETGDLSIVVSGLEVTSAPVKLASRSK